MSTVDSNSLLRVGEPPGAPNDANDPPGPSHSLRLERSNKCNCQRCVCYGCYSKSCPGEHLIPREDGESTSLPAHGGWKTPTHGDSCSLFVCHLHGESSESVRDAPIAR